MTIEIKRYSRQPSLLIVLCALSLTPFNVCGQVNQPHRYEVIAKSSDEPFTIIALKEDGLLLTREKNKYEGGKQLWEVIVLDTLLVKKHQFDIAVKDRFPFIGYDYVDGHLYLLYRESETTHSNFELVDLDVEQGKEVQRFQIKPELDFKITHFNNVGDNILLGGYVSNEPAILLYQMKENQLKVVPGFFQKNNELSDVRINQNGTFNVVVLDRSLRSEPKLIFRTYDQNGVQLLDDVVPFEEDYDLQTSITSTLIREDLLVAGTWGDRQGKQSKGFFTLSIDPFTDQKFKFLSFGELDHFTDYLNPKRASRIKENTKEDLSDRVIPAFSTYTIPFKLDEHPKGFFLLSEVYNPSSRTNPYYNNPYGSPYGYNPYGFNPYWPGYYPGMRMYRPTNFGNNVKSADEIKTNASVLVAFDAAGRKLWDHSMKVDEVKKPSLEQLSDYFFNGKYVHFIHKNESDLKVKVIEIESGAATDFTEKIKLPAPQDEIRNERELEGGVRHWFGRYFYSWGYQTIKNNTQEDRVRDVFYINKVFVD